MADIVKPRATIIVAYNERHVIGNNLGKVPWHIKEDLQFFRNKTMGHPCIMGRKTWEGIPEKYRPLPGRFNIVVTRQHRGFPFPAGAFDKMAACGDVETAIALGKQLDKDEVFITGGAQVYRYCLDNNLVDRVLASEIKNHLEVEGATFFPDLSAFGWKGEVVERFAEFEVKEFFKNAKSENKPGTAAAGAGDRRTADAVVSK